MTITHVQSSRAGAAKPIIARLLIYGGLIVIMALLLPNLARKMIYPAPSMPIPDPPPAGVQTVNLSADGDAPGFFGWLLHASEQKKTTPIVIYFHGNGENLATLWENGTLTDLNQCPATVLAVEYPGYGGLQGQPNETALVACGDSALKWARQKFPENPIVIAGWSLGSGVAAQVAQRNAGAVNGIILMSAWTSLKDVGAHHYPRFLVNWLVADTYDSIAAARSIQTPALVIHGTQDAIIPATQGKRLADSLRYVRWVAVDPFEHNDLLSAGQTWDAIRAFLKRVAAPDNY